MKQLRKHTLLLLTAALLISLCSCGQKVKPEKIDTGDYSRTMALETSGGSISIVHSDKTVEEAKNGAVLKSDDSLSVGAGSGLIIAADDDKQIHVQENTKLRMEASGDPQKGKTRICLEEGSVLCALAQPLPEGALFEVQTSGGTVSTENGLIYVSILESSGVKYILADVFAGEGKVVINATGDQVSLKSGQAAMIRQDGKKCSFVLSDEIAEDFWKSPDFADMKADAKGTGSAVLEIPYSKLPGSVLEQLIGYAQEGRTLSLSEEALRDLLESGHYYEEHILQEATCTEAGKLERVCLLCEAVQEQEIPAVGHVEEELPAVEPDCLHDGLTAGTKCSVCGEVLTAQEAIPAAGHVDEEIPAVAASCETEGLSAGVRCAVCGEVTVPQEPVPALGHTPVVVPGVEATCTETGLTEGQKCSACGQWLVPQTDIPTVAHEMETQGAKAPTCTEPGITAGVRCRNCGLAEKDSEEIPALGHTPVVIPGREPTCTRPGLTEGKRCSVCGAIVEAQASIPMADHTPEAIPAAESTCCEQGLTEGSKCAVCGKILTAQEPADLAPHTPEVIPAVGSTCSKCGLTEGCKCSVCGQILTEQESTEKCAHTPVVIPGREPTCARPGLTDGERCSVCNQILKKQETIPTLEHTPKSILGKYTTCFREGHTDTIVCEVCGVVLDPGEVIPMVPHVKGGLAAIAPTCTSVGRTEGLACQICSYIMKPTEVIPKLPHAPVDTPARILSGNIPVLVDGKANLGLLESEYCYRDVTTCKMCGEVLRVDYFAHTKGEETTFVNADGVTIYQCKCKICKEIIEQHAVNP